MQKNDVKSPSSYHIQKINSKWITDLNLKAKTIKLLEGNIGEDLCDLGLGKAFLDMISKALVTKRKIR